MFEGSEGAVYYVFTNKAGERYYGSRTDIEFLIELMQMRLKWLKDERPSVQCSKCNRLSPNKGETDQANARCGEKMSEADPGCDGLMLPICAPKERF